MVSSLLLYITQRLCVAICFKGRVHVWGSNLFSVHVIIAVDEEDNDKHMTESLC